MRIAIGFRCRAADFHWATVSGGSLAPVVENHGKVTAPRTYSDSMKLGFLLTEARSLIRQHKAGIVAIREPEFGRSRCDIPIRWRLRVEGAIVTTACEAGLECHVVVLTKVSSAFGVKKPKALLEADDLRGLNWSKFGLELREAILVAATVLG